MTRNYVWMLLSVLVLALAMSAVAAWGAGPTSAPAGGARDVVRQSRAPLEGDSEKDGQRLREAVERLRATTIEPRPARPAVDSPPARHAEPDLSEHALTTRPAAVSPPGEITTEHLSVLRTLKDLPADEAALVGAALQQAGHLEEAFGFFEQAFGAGPAADQAYLLLQMAHCKRAADPVAAQALYRRVVAEHAGTPWATLAEAYDSILEFARMHKPAETIRDATKGAP